MKTSVIAVHGLGGDWQDTWTQGKRNDGVFWLKDDTFWSGPLSFARVWSFGYNASFAFSRSIADIYSAADSKIR